jgi:uncharacterized membrane protein (DUF2068 family)
MSETPKKQTEVLKRAPTLYAIITFKVLKGLLFVILAFTAYLLSDNDLPAEFQKMLHLLRLNPERRFWMDLADHVSAITEARMVRAAIGTLIYSMFSLVEGVGLMLRVSWAGWLAIGESLFFIPIEVHALVKGFSWIVFVILVVNVLIVWYLYKNRETLFRHHHRH